MLNKYMRFKGYIVDANYPMHKYIGTFDLRDIKYNVIRERFTDSTMKIYFTDTEDLGYMIYYENTKWNDYNNAVSADYVACYNNITIAVYIINPK